MIKKEGKVYNAVAKLLQKAGRSTEGLEVATLCRGSDHLILIKGETVGEYNHISKNLKLYPE